MTVELHSLTKSYGNVVAVDRFSLAIAPGELVALLGPSGCGKTTVLRLVAGFDAPETGEISLGGQDCRFVPPDKRGVSMVFQHFALFPHMSVRQNVAYGLKFAARGRDPAARVQEMLRLVNLDGLEDRKPLALSAGQQQRVALARALAPHPRVLLLDEPLSALDAALREQLRLEIRRLQQHLGISALYVTHDQEEALAIADRVVVMRNGRAEQIGTPWDVYDRPQTPFVAGFIGRGIVLPARVAGVDPEGVRADAEGLAYPVTIPSERLIRTAEPGATPGASLPPAAATAHLVLRPERLQASPVSDDELAAGAGGRGRLRGRLVEAEFLGATGRVVVEGGAWRASAIVDPRDVPSYRGGIGAWLDLSFDAAEAVLIVG